MSCDSNNLNQLYLIFLYHQNGKKETPKSGFALFEKTISPLKNLGSVMIVYVVSCDDYPVGVKNEMFVEILL